jgi:hypothetical protein
MAANDDLEPDSSSVLVKGIAEMLADPAVFAAYASHLELRPYQVEVARAIVHSVRDGLGLSFVVMFPRQSGKNEVQAQLEAYLLALYSQKEAEIVKISPTWKPQSINAMRRLERVLKDNPVVESWQKESGYIYRVGSARMFFFSGSPEANIVGATASLLLEVDEAQNIRIEKFDTEIAPMAASTNATRVFWGTAWTSQTLLARELRAAREAEAQDGLRRTFVLTAEDVANVVPAYGKHVAEQVARLGRQNPTIKTQYFSEEIDAESGMFPAERVMLMKGSHAWQATPKPGGLYAFLLDVAGEDASGGEPGESQTRDSTVLTIVEVMPGKTSDLLNRPSYRVLSHKSWTGCKHTRLYAEIKALAEVWQPRVVVVDATGLGAGLASFLESALPGRVRPFLFSTASKSKLGWDFLALIDSGRYQEPVAGEAAATTLMAEFWRQLSFCQYEIRPGAEKRLKWGVPDGTRDPADGELVHDDMVISAALTARLDAEAWQPAAPTLIVQAADPLKEMDQGF